VHDDGFHHTNAPCAVMRTGGRAEMEVAGRNGVDQRMEAALAAHGNLPF
jgi:hypothetical protein